MPTLLKEKIVFNDKLVLEEAHIQDEQNEVYTRIRINRQDASAVLLFNTDSQKVILTQQYRYPVAAHQHENLSEILAGKVDPGEHPLDTAIREAEEETGYAIQPANIRFLLSCFASPGYSTERYHLYYATVTDNDLQSKGGGLVNENECIQLVELDVEDFRKSITEGKIKDAKTILAGLYVWR